MGEFIKIIFVVFTCLSFCSYKEISATDDTNQGDTIAEVKGIDRVNGD